MINPDIQNSTTYNTYLAFATRAATPKKARKWKQHAFAPKNKAFTDEDPDVAEKVEAARLVPKTHKTLVAEEPPKMPIGKSQPTGVIIIDNPVVSVSKKNTPTCGERNKGNNLLSEASLLEEAQMKKAINR
ncbi:hypothetical protein Tco_0395508, partial [Tanacetum coccineum]